MSLKVSAAALAIAVAGLFAASAQAAPVAPAQGPKAVIDGLQVETVQYYHNRRKYCWYWDGWKGPGWYWCGYQMRRGYGWGGGSGWNSWSSPPRVYRQPPPRRYYRDEPRRHYRPY